jgi:protein arginine kinase activator
MSKIKICTHCGFTWDEFLSRRVLGCAQCYSTFSFELKGVLAEFHSHIKHLSSGSSVGTSDEHTEKFEKLAQLRDLLSKAVRQEKFEEALRIKKEISRLESKSESG